MQRRMWWDFYAGYERNQSVYRNHSDRLYKHFSFSKSSDIIDQFNFIGYSDVCVYPGVNQLSPYNPNPTDRTTKDTRYVIGGFIGNNQTGTEY